MSTRTDSTSHQVVSSFWIHLVQIMGGVKPRMRKSARIIRAAVLLIVNVPLTHNGSTAHRACPAFSGHPLIGSRDGAGTLRGCRRPGGAARPQEIEKPFHASTRLCRHIEDCHPWAHS